MCDSLNLKYRTLFSCEIRERCLLYWASLIQLRRSLSLRISTVKRRALRCPLVVVLVEKSGQPWQLSLLFVAKKQLSMWLMADIKTTDPFHYRTPDRRLTKTELVMARTLFAASNVHPAVDGWHRVKSSQIIEVFDEIGNCEWLPQKLLIIFKNI